MLRLPKPDLAFSAGASTLRCAGAGLLAAFAFDFGVAFLAIRASLGLELNGS
jgi:hypothetical protein